MFGLTGLALSAVFGVQLTVVVWGCEMAGTQQSTFKRIFYLFNMLKFMQQLFMLVKFIHLYILTDERMKEKVPLTPFLYGPDSTFERPFYNLWGCPF